MAARLMLGRVFLKRSTRLLGARSFAAVPYSTKNVSLAVRQGFPVLALPLPSRRDTCDFVLRPYLQTVADLTSNIRREDGGIESVSLHTVEGNRIAGSTLMGLVLQSTFDLKINDVKYRVEPSPETNFPSDPLKSFEELKTNVNKLYSLHNVPEHQLSKDLELRGQLEQLRAELAPLERQYLQLAEHSSRRTEIVMWGGLSWMCAQFGFLAYLVWGEYDWDIMEPVTYFVGYGSSILLFAYFLLTRQDYAEASGHDRYFLNFIHRRARREKFDINRYNELKEAASDLRRRLNRLHDPLQLNLPAPPSDHHS